MGFGTYSSILFRKVSELEFIVFPHQRIKVNNVTFEIKKMEVKQEKKYYKLISPWIALHHDNYEKFKKLQSDAKKYFLEKILIGNILSVLKGLKIFIDFKIEVEIENIKSFPISANENTFQGFFCAVRTNIHLPNYVGIQLIRLFLICRI